MKLNQDQFPIDDNQAMTSFADLNMTLMLCFFVLALLSIQHITNEMLTKINMAKNTKESQQVVKTVGENTIYLSMTKDGQYVLEGKALKQNLKFNNPDSLQAKLVTLAPSHLVLRIDKDARWEDGTLLYINSQKVAGQVSIASLRK